MAELSFHHDSVDPHLGHPREHSISGVGHFERVQSQPSYARSIHDVP